MGNNAFTLLAILLILSGVAALEYRSLKASVVSYAVQGFAMAATLAAAAGVSGISHLYAWAITLVISKGLLIPWIMLRYARATRGEDLAEPRLGRFCGALLLAGAVWYAGITWMPWLLEGVPGAVSTVPGGLAAAAAIIAMALYGVLTHRDTFKVAVAIALLENGAHLFLACTAFTMPELISIGVVADVILAVWLLLLVGREAEKTTGERTDLVLDQVGRGEVSQP